ncbi:MAG TPA: PD-(D/E)XK nuclease family protein [Lacunisphaera sp.]|nr:PD-(D/E)XK nuclease family protein [Lacunisphaera sp.]
MQPRCELHLARDWESAWRDLVRPWLAAPAALRRDYIVVPTRGQAVALKLRCVRENLPLLGVEFLTPGLARQKWHSLAAADAAADSPLRRPALGRELLLLGLRRLIEERLAPLAPEDRAWGLWKSLQSDPEQALHAFDELLQAGFTAADFPLAALREIFADLTTWVDELGYTLAPIQNERAALTEVAPGGRIAGRLLMLGFTAEAWHDFFSLAALARRCSDLMVIVPEPELRGGRTLDENWVELWSTLLGVEARPPAAVSTAQAGAAVGALWAGEGGAATSARVLVGRTRTDEMRLLAAELERLVATGADNIAVIFPRADAAHGQLTRLLQARGLIFADLVGTAGQPSIEAQLQRALLAFYERGARLEEFLSLWPLLRALNFVRQPLAVARDVCERLFDEAQSHALENHLAELATAEREDRREIGRVAALLLPAWPAELTLAEALQRLEKTGASFNLAPPESWPALTAFAQQETRRLPVRVIFATLRSFLAPPVPAVDAPGRGVFAPLTLTTRRRAAGLAWSHLILTESNAGVWPERKESSSWLTDEQRGELNQRGRFSLGLFSRDDLAGLEKQAYVALARDTAGEVIFTAALFDDEEPELRLAPNAWLERVLIAQGEAAGPGGLEESFARLAQGGTAPGPVDRHEAWLETWRRRRDPAAGFDEYFLGGPADATRPARLAARQIERGVQDPAELWFDAVLRVQRVDWAPLVRARKRSLGQLAHRLLAAALRGEPIEGPFARKPAVETARASLAAGLAALRERWPHDRYWDSLHAELAETCSVLLDKVFALPSGPVVATEIRLPPTATVGAGAAGTVAISGRIDLVLLDRPEWRDAQVEIVDFKTGADAGLSVAAMARGAGLQLGVYLAAAASLGIAGGRVWMLKPGPGSATSLELAELPAALVGLEQIGRHLATGRYGALTPDRTEFTHGFEWPLACTPVPHAILAEKYALTFGTLAPEPEEAGDE